MKRRRVEFEVVESADALEEVTANLRNCMKMAENSLWEQLRPRDGEAAEKQNEGDGETESKQVRSVKPYRHLLRQYVKVPYFSGCDGTNAGCGNV